jgi:hypothetical protein
MATMKQEMLQKIETELAESGARLDCLNALQNFIGDFAQKNKVAPTALQINRDFIIPMIAEVERKSAEIGKQIKALNNLKQ